MDKKTLFALTTEAKDIAQVLIENDGELPKELEIALDENAGALCKKVDGYKFIIERLNLEAEYWKAKKKECQAVEKALTNNSKRIKTNLKDAMKNLEVEELRGNGYRFCLHGAAPKLEIDEDKLPEEYWEEVITKRPNTMAIGMDLKDGVDIPGARLLENNSLRSYPIKGK